MFCISMFAVFNLIREYESELLMTAGNYTIINLDHQVEVSRPDFSGGTTCCSILAKDHLS